MCLSNYGAFSREMRVQCHDEDGRFQNYTLEAPKDALAREAVHDMIWKHVIAGSTGFLSMMS